VAEDAGGKVSKNGISSHRDRFWTFSRREQGIQEYKNRRRRNLIESQTPPKKSFIKFKVILN